MNPAYLLLGALLLLGGGFKMPAFLQHKPATAQLAQAQADLAKAKADREMAEAALAAAKAEQDARTAKQLDYAQQFAAGTSLALTRVPPEQITPEIRLATELAARANAGLEAARGKLPPEARAEIQLLIDQALSAKSAEVVAYKQALAEKDAALQLTIQEKAVIERKIPVLEASVITAKAATDLKSAEVNEKTHEVAAWADAKAASDAKAGSLDAYADHLVRILIGLGILYALIHFALPSLAQEFPGVKILDTLNKTAKSISSSHL